MNVVFIFISILVSIFVFLLFTNIRSSNLEVVIRRMEEHGINFFKKNRIKFKWNSDLKFLLRQEGSLRVLGFNIKSLERLFLLRIALASGFFVIFIIIGLLLERSFIIFALVLALIFYLLPVEVLKGKVRARSNRISSELPDFIDILSSLIKAGLNLDEAISYISNNYKSEISKLFKLSRVKILEGFSKKEAYYDIAKLSFCSDFEIVVKVLMQSDIVGNPIKDVLKDLSRVFRNNQRDVLKMRAERLEGNLMIVIFIFVFIPMLLLFLLPVFSQLKMLF